MFRRIIRGINDFITMIVFLVLMIIAAYACYALWDNAQIYQEASNVQEDMKRLKPLENEEESPSFAELLKINKDVCAWITMDNTGIDYPVLQGKDNMDYINTDVYGKFSLAGSIFLDTRCSEDFSDSYSLLYGHHMTNHLMFGDLDYYKEKDFFDENRTGALITQDNVYKLKTVACMMVGASEDRIFEPYIWENCLDELLIYIQSDALHYDKDEINLVRQKIEDYNQGTSNIKPRIVALSTCSSDFTDARTILITSIQE